MGPIKVAEDPSLCLNAPGQGVLQLWPCDKAHSGARDFTVQEEPSGWIGVPHFDLADKHDAENMDASDLKAVIKRAEQLGYAGFSVFHGRAFLKNVNHLTLKDLKYMGNKNPNVFYLRRKQQSRDVSVRLTWRPHTCVLVPTKVGESRVVVAPCKGPNRGSRSVSDGVWTIGMLVRLKGEMMADAGDEISERDSAPTLADDPRFHGLRFLHQQQSQRQQEQQAADSLHWQ